MGLESESSTDARWRCSDHERLREEQSTTMSSPTSTGTPAVQPPRPKPPRKTLYRGDPGMWSWVLHRISGAAIFFFLGGMFCGPLPHVFVA